MLRIGILMGGRSREREVSFAGGRTVFDNLDRKLFQPVPIFIDSFGTFILLDWQYLYKGTIPDFFPPAEQIPPELQHFQCYVEHLDTLTPEAYGKAIRNIGVKIELEQLPRLMDFAFLTLHGSHGEDGSIQGLLEWLGIPFSGSGLAGSKLGMDKIRQKEIMTRAGYPCPHWMVLDYNQAFPLEPDTISAIEQQVGFPCILKHPTQGSSIGTAITQAPEDLPQALDQAFFRHRIDTRAWRNLPESDRIRRLQQLSDPRYSLGLPAWYGDTLIRSPLKLYNLLEDTAEPVIELRAPDAPESILIEQFIEGREFSVIVIEDEAGEAVGLPPTLIEKAAPVYDFRSKYLPGLVRKQTPMPAPAEVLHRICRSGEQLKELLHISVYARLDGFWMPDDTLYFNDPNTTSGMMPGSFFFHQAAEAGFNPSQFLTYIIRTSLLARIREQLLVEPARKLLEQLDHPLRADENHTGEEKKRIAVILGGPSFERHISVESGRNVYQKLSSTVEYEPCPYFLLERNHALQLGASPEQLEQLGLSGPQPFSFWQLPIRMLLKDHADDIALQLIQATHVNGSSNASGPAFRDQLRLKLQDVEARYDLEEAFTPAPQDIHTLARHTDAVFLALHGRPGEDGTLQQLLESQGIPYNGSRPASASLTIDKYATNERLAQAGFYVAQHRIVTQKDWSNQPICIEELESVFPYPFIAKPVDDGCSSAVRIIQNRSMLEAYARTMFRTQLPIEDALRAQLNLKPAEEFPMKSRFLVETLIQAASGEKLIEITVGFVTRYQQDGQLQYVIFEPSEVLAESQILSLEEKFLAGEGQNMTPARFSYHPEENRTITAEVKRVIESVARTLAVEGYARVDAFVKLLAHGTIQVFIIEINALPGITPATCLFHQSAMAGLTPVKLFSEIIDFGFQRQARLERQTVTLPESDPEYS